MVEFSGDEFAWLKDVYGPNAFEWGCCAEFRDGALRGVKYALNHVAGVERLDDVLIRIGKIDATPADTTGDDVAYAACYATWNALDVAGRDAPKFVGKGVVFTNEVRP
jgi:hypothetical protein